MTHTDAHKPSTVLVLGSKPGSRIPDITPSAIYSANGAAALIWEVPGAEDAQRVCVAAAGAIDLPTDRRAILDAQPHKVIIRKRNPIQKKLLQDELPDAELSDITLREQWQFQRKTFGLRLLFSELCYATTPIGKLKRLNKHCRRGFASLGASTGLFAVLTAAEEHPSANIFIAGIGIQPGGHFYDHDDKPHGARARVDSILFSHLPEKLKLRISTTDLQLEKVILGHIRSTDLA